MTRLRTLWRDLSRMAVVAGIPTLLRYLWALLTHAPSVWRVRTLAPVDAAMIVRDYTFRPLPNVSVRIRGHAFDGAREMYCRGVYFVAPGFEPGAGQRVVDVGANKGLFTVMAARAGATVLAVEAQKGLVDILLEHARLNSVLDRVVPVRVLIGASVGVLSSGQAREESAFWSDDVVSASLKQVLDDAGFTTVDLLKMDIEGSEFEVFKSAHDWLPRVQRIVLEVHADWGRPEELIEQLSSAGFAITMFDRDSRPVARPGPNVQYVFAQRR